MKAAVLEKINKPLTVTEVGLTELTFGQVLVKILVSGICGAQLQEISGQKNNAKYVPHLLGHEGCGIVEDVGVGVFKVKKGDKVVMHWRKGDGIESDFPAYVFKGKKINSGKITTFSQYSIVSENRITPVPQDTPNDFCALLGCGLSTALGTVENNMKSGEKVMIIGMGGLGACCVKAALFLRASQVVGVDVFDKSKLVSKLGGVFIKSGEQLPKDFDVIINTTGSAESISDTIPLLGPSGRYIMIGQPKPGESVVIKDARHLFGGEGKVIKATEGGGFSPSRDIPRFVALNKAGVLNIENIISHKIRLPEINKAIDMVKKGRAVRILIEM